MKKQNMWIALLGVVLLFIGIWSLWFLMKQRYELDQRATILSEDARLIAGLNTECSTSGVIAATGDYERSIRSWNFAIDLWPSWKREGCEAVCRVNDRMKVAELIWNCTALDTPFPDASGSADGVQIQVFSPQPNMKIASPFTVSGQARGSWFFEASFPFQLLDGSGTSIASGYAQAKGDWMTSEFVPFSGVLEFTTPATPTGTLVIEKNNPSGLSENADEERIPVKFVIESPTPTSTPTPVITLSPEGEITLFYYNPEKDKDAEGNILCSDQGLAPVKRPQVATETPIDDAVELLISGVVTPEEEAEGITTEFPLAGFKLESSNLENGELTLTFADPQFRTSGGSCRATILWAQIYTTAKNFPGIESVRFMPEELFQP